MSFRKFLPGRTVTAFVVIPVFAILVFTVASDYKEKRINSTGKEHNIIKEKLREEVVEKDTDGDGLKDWEERLYNTDPKDKDTDKDGLLDGLEIKSGTDPTDPLNTIEEVQREIQDHYSDDENITYSDDFSRDILVKFTQLKESGLVGNKSAQNLMIEELFDENKVNLENRYLIEDIKVSNTATPINFKKELTDTLRALKNTEDDMFLYISYLDSKDQKFLTSLKDNQGKYEELMLKLLLIEVPKDASYLYLDYINAYGVYIDSLTGLIKSHRNSIAAVAYMTSTKEIDDNLLSSGNTLAAYFSLHSQ